jgi:glyoxylase-like metal-dependent hydrolase (beta-lactamase superfamily II)
VHFGDLSLQLISDGVMWLDGGALFGLVPKVLWGRVAQPDELNRVPVALNCLLIESQGQRILVDTGLGDKLPDKQRRNWGLQRPQGGLVDGLHRLGLDVEEIDIVINTHLHLDHCGGNTTLRDGRPVPTFPRAEYWVQRSEWAEAGHPNERTRAVYLSENLRPIAGAGQLRLLDGDTQVTDAVRCVVHRGHTPAYQSAILESGGQSAVYIGDLAPFATHLERIQWLPAFDVLPLDHLEAKREVRDWALERSALLIFQHDPFISWGRLTRDEEGRYHVVSTSSPESAK